MIGLGRYGVGADPARATRIDRAGVTVVAVRGDVGADSTRATRIVRAEVTVVTRRCMGADSARATRIRCAGVTVVADRRVGAADRGTRLGGAGVTVIASGGIHATCLWFARIRGARHAVVALMRFLAPGAGRRTARGALAAEVRRAHEVPEKTAGRRALGERVARRRPRRDGGETRVGLSRQESRQGAGHSAVDVVARGAGGSRPLEARSTPRGPFDLIHLTERAGRRSRARGELRRAGKRARGRRRQST